MIKQELGLTELEKQVYNRFRRALNILPIYSGTELILLPEDEETVQRAKDDAYALCEEMETDESEITLYDDQICLLAILAAVDFTKQIDPILRYMDYDGRNFDD